VRQVILLRHATAGGGPGIPDEQRPLTARGREEAEGVALVIAASLPPSPLLTLCSTAVRARQTLVPIAERAPGVREPWFERDLYLAPARALLERLQLIDDGFAATLVVGHNPALQQLAVDLCHRKADRTRLRSRFAPATLAVIELAVDRWGALRDGDGVLLDLRHA
jgi:phosphohistidine phosphatase